MLVIGDLALQLLIVVLGLVLFFDPHTLTAQIHLGSAPTWSSFVFALTIAAIAFTSLESAAGLAGEVRIGRAGLRQMVASGAATVVIGYVGIAVVADHGAAGAQRPHGAGRALSERSRDGDRHADAPALARAGPALPRRRRSRR